jgi:hypothetical protein
VQRQQHVSSVRPLYDGLRAAWWRAVNYSPHESSACRHDIGSPRSTVTVRGSLNLDLLCEDDCGGVGSVGHDASRLTRVMASPGPSLQHGGSGRLQKVRADEFG